MNDTFRIIVTEHEGDIHTLREPIVKNTEGGDNEQWNHAAAQLKNIQPIIKEEGNVMTITIPKEKLNGRNYETLRIETSLLTAKAGEPGYMFFPTNFGSGFVAAYFTERENTEFRSWLSATPVAGICGNDRAVFARIDGMQNDARFYAEVRDHVYRLCPEFQLDGEDLYEDISVVFYRMPNATYVDMAKLYRKYQMEVKGCVPLAERMKNRPQLKRASECLELRIRMGWKPIPTHVRHQTLENEPPMKVAVDIERLNTIVDKMYAKGIRNVEICLVGWAVGGHDGRFPQQVPVDPRFGKKDADAEMKAFIKKAQDMGYLVVCHTVSCGAYEIADNWDPKKCCQHKTPDLHLAPYVRDHYVKYGLNGGEPFALCARCAYEDYAVRDLPKVKAYGFEGMHYIDEFTAYTPDTCLDPEHPVNRKQAREYYRKCAQLSTKLFGGYQCEGWMDFMNADVDAILYTQVQSRPGHGLHPLFDEGIPFWQLTFHGIVMSNVSSQTVNYPAKEKMQHLKFLEYGGRPLMYFYSKFGDDRNWMGDIDLHADTEADIDQAVEMIKIAADEYDQNQSLQYAFMENHEKISENRYRSTFSDGTVITVDYDKETYEITRP